MNVVNQVAEEAINEGLDVIVEGPTIFKSSNTAKVVFGTVVVTAVSYGIFKGIKWFKDKKKVVEPELVEDDIFEEEPEDIEETE